MDSYAPIQTWISGKVYDAVTGAGIPNAVVYTQPATQEVMTDNKGAYLLEVSASEETTYRVHAEKEGYASAFVSIRAREGQSALGDIPLSFAVLPQIFGQVTDGTTGLPLARVEIYTEPASERVFSDELGAYALSEGIRPGMYELVAAREGYEAKRFSLRVAEAQNTEADFSLQPRGAELAVSPSTLDFGVHTERLQIEVDNLGDGELRYSIAPPQASWLLPEVGLMQGVVTDTARIVPVSVERTGLSGGIHQTELRIVSNAGEAVVAVQVIVAGPDEPIVSVSPLQLTFAESQQSAQLRIRNRGTGALQWEIFESVSWLRVNQAQGQTLDEEDLVEIEVSRENLSNGTYQAILYLQSNDADIEIPVSMAVATSPEPLDEAVAYPYGSVQQKWTQPLASPRGIAYAAGALWVGSQTGTLVKLDTDDGTEHARVESGLLGIVDLAATAAGDLWIVTQLGEAYRFRPSSGELSFQGDVQQPKGIARSHDALVTWEDNRLKSRAPQDFTVQSVRTCTEDGNFITQIGANFISHLESRTLDAIQYEAIFKNLRADLAGQAPLRNTFSLPIHASQIRGLTSFDSTLWVLTDGSGPDADRVIRVQMNP